MTTSTFDKIYANAQNMNIETSEWFNRAQGCKTIMRDDGEWFVLKNGNIIKA